LPPYRRIRALIIAPATLRGGGPPTPEISPMPSLRSVALATFLALALAAPSGTALAQMMPCANEILPLREQVQKDGLAVKAAIDKKDRGEICSTLKRFTAAEAKFVKFMEDNQAWCAIPPEVIPQLKKNQANGIKLRGKACAPGTAAGAPAVPAGPGLSEALGTSRGPTGKTKAGTGTFDTLTGPSIQQ
jgi:hypothetical protein